MEKRCEFCMALRPVVFCKSDAAHLCLSCDAKVHSANALSYRHPRTLVCESCRFQPALVRCFDHQMFMCQGCDISHHESFEHQKKIVSCYMGCPSAKDLADLWGFDLKDQSSAAANSSDHASSLVSELDGYVESREMKVVNDDNQHKSSSYLILQQIMDLERLQLSEGVDDSCLVNVKERSCGSPLRHDATWKEHRMLDDDTPLDKTEEPLSSPFPQLESLTNTNGDAFWQYRSPVHNNEIWLQNMQDLGVCDEVQCFDDVKIPDVDLTFRNFEELFGGEQQAAGEHQSDGDCATTVEKHDESHPIHPLSIRPSRSISSFSFSRITGETSGSDNVDDDLSQTYPKQCVLHAKSSATIRHKEKKVGQHEKQGQHTSPRSKSDFKKRGKSRVLKVEGDSGSF